MRRLLLLTLFTLACGQAHAARDASDPQSAAALPGAFIVLCYHEVRADVRDYPDPFAVDEGSLVAQLGWLRGNGYSPVSLDQIVAARSGGKPRRPRPCCSLSTTVTCRSTRASTRSCANSAIPQCSG